jgi:hypothetical protein
MEVALYIRVSTGRQQQQQTIEQQLARLRDYVATQPDWHLDEAHIYRDDGSSGAKLNRPGLDGFGTRRPWQSSSASSSRRPIAWPATLSIRCS